MEEMVQGWGLVWKASGASRTDEQLEAEEGKSVCKRPRTKSFGGEDRDRINPRHQHLPLQ